MRRHEEEKKALERAAIDIFIELYNCNNELPLKLLQQREKPDALLEDAEGGRLGLEVTHLFYDAEEARLMMSRSEMPLPDTEELSLFIQTINQRIRNKEEKFKDYAQDCPCALLIRNYSLVFGMSDVLRAKHELVKPGRHFTQVWLLSRDFTPDWLLINLFDLGDDDDH